METLQDQPPAPSSLSRSEPPKNKTPTVIRYAGNEFFIATTPSGHSLAIDISDERKSTAGPLELFIAGLAACTATDVISVLHKKRERVTDYRLEVHTERRVEHPRSFTKIMLKHIIRGKNISPQAVARAVDLSTNKYCSAVSTVRPTAEIITSYEIEEDANAS